MKETFKFATESADSGIHLNNASDQERLMSVSPLATHLPDQVVYCDHNRKLPQLKNMQGVLMFLDISGFTSLCEKYGMNSKNGTDKLTKTLNGYMGALVNEILSHDGDVLKYAGDAILTVWQVEKFLDMRPTVLHVIQCALTIQRKYGAWQTSVGVMLKVKLGIAAGELSVTYVGNEEFCHYVTVGRCVTAVNAAEKFCVSGDIVVSPTAWCHITTMEIEYEICNDNKHVKILNMDEIEYPEDGHLYLLNRTLTVSDSVGNLIDKQIDPSKQARKGSMESLQIRSALNVEISTSNFPQLSENAESTSSLKLSVKPKEVTDMRDAGKIAHKKMGPISEQERRVRMSVLKGYSDSINAKLRLYIAPPVLKKLDEHQPLEYLSEMRQVTIVFINLVTVETLKHEQAFLLQEIFSIIYTNVKKSQGCMNKIFMFDKGCTFLVIFGLPGFKHESDCAHALLSSHRMKQELSKNQQVLQTSIGVTTGSTYCGVVGHNHRHEYTVIGRKVNMAARLMMHYPDMLTCDNETFHHSKMPKTNFVVLETKLMKGLKNPGTIREFKGYKGTQSVLESLKIQEAQYPLIGRDRELKICLDELKLIQNNPSEGSQRQLIIFEGEPGIGKSRMLDSIVLRAMKLNVNVISCKLTMHDSKTPYFMVKSMLIDLLKTDMEKPHQEREQHLLNMFTNPFIIKNLSVLNDLLHLKLPQSDSYVGMDIAGRAGLLHKLLFEIVHETCAHLGFVIFAVDDAHLMDKESWEFANDLGQDMRSLVVLTVRTNAIPGIITFPAVKQVLHADTTLRIVLEGLENMYMTTLACQLLDVIEIPHRLDKLLKERSHGVPSWCDQLLQELYYSNSIMVVPKKEKLSHFPGGICKDSAVTPPKSFVRSRLSSTAGIIAPPSVEKKLESSPSDDDEISSRPFSATEQDTQIMVCIIPPNQDIETGIPDSIKAMLTVRIDRMEQVDQMILKCGSILGSPFSREMLDFVITSGYQMSMAAGIRRLLEQGILQCGAISQMDSTTEQQESSSEQCNCKVLRGNVLVKPAECQMFSFKNPIMQETAYGMFVESSRQSLHMSAAQFLENQAHKCKVCGGGNFSDAKTDAKGGEATAIVVPSVDISQLPESRTDDTTNQNLALLSPDKRGSIASSGKIRRHSLTISSMRSSFSRKDSTVEPVIPKRQQNLRSSVEGLASDEKTMNMLDSVVSEVDMRECQCVEILASIHPQLVRHWRAAGNIEKTIYFLFEASAAAIATYDNMQALSYLKEVRRIVDEVKEGKNPFEGETTITDQYELGEWEEARLESLMGQALYHLGQVQESIPHFHEALRIMGNPQPTSSLGISWRIFKQRLLQWCHLQSPDSYFGKCNAAESVRLREQSRCLSHVFQDYLRTNDDRMAYMTALQQVNTAEYVGTDLLELVIAYTAMMETCLMKKWYEYGHRIESIAQAKCAAVLSNPHNLENWMTAVYLYITSLTMRIVRGRVSEAIDVGYLAAKIARRLHNNDLSLQLLPLLSQGLLLAGRVTDCAEVLEDLLYISDETDDTIGKTWYMNCCWDLILEAGFQREDCWRCVEFSEGAMFDKSFHADHLPLYYMTACLTLWCMRRGDFLEAKRFHKVVDMNKPENYNTFMAIHGFFKLLEGQLIHLSHEVSECNKPMITELKRSIKQDVEVLKRSCHTAPVFKPRLYHLQAYKAAILGKRRKATKLLKQCMEQSLKAGNMLEHDWASHSQLVWFEPHLQQQQAVFWLKLMKTNNGWDMPDWHAATKLDGSVTKFSLPLPQ